jgi:hypothetical protein
MYNFIYPSRKGKTSLLHLLLIVGPGKIGVFICKMGDDTTLLTYED